MFLDEDEEDEVVEVAAAADEENDESAAVESQASKVQSKPSSGTIAKKRQSTLQFKTSSKEQPKTNKSVVEMLRRTPEEVVDELCLQVVRLIAIKRD
jgi:hypothetical protein